MFSERQIIPQVSQRVRNRRTNYTDKFGQKKQFFSPCVRVRVANENGDARSDGWALGNWVRKKAQHSLRPIAYTCVCVVGSGGIGAGVLVCVCVSVKRVKIERLSINPSRRVAV